MRRGKGPLLYLGVDDRTQGYIHGKANQAVIVQFLSHVRIFVTHELQQARLPYP